tara:strand:+ start:2508 stop:3113 length:606 start_codon:yes stop_codon:yes gene_type:complete
MDSDLLFYGEKRATSLLVLLHGWGADAEDLMDLGINLIKDKKSISIVSLKAPYLHPSGEGRQWYGLFPADWSAVPSEVNALSSRLKQISRDLDVFLEKTILLGFSQGAAMALNVGFDLPLAGLISCSGYPHPSWIPSKEQKISVLLTHGINDSIVPFQASEKALTLISETRSNVKLVSFEGGHNIPIEIFSEIRNFIIKNI